MAYCKLLASSGSSTRCAQTAGATERPVRARHRRSYWRPGCRADRRVGARLSRAPDVAGCVAIPSYSPADSESAGFYASPPTSRTHYSAAMGAPADLHPRARPAV